MTVVPVADCTGLAWAWTCPTCNPDGLGTQHTHLADTLAALRRHVTCDHGGPETVAAQVDPRQNDGQVWDNKNGPRGAGNTTEGLTAPPLNPEAEVMGYDPS